jgi:hypothetical protein
VRVVVAGWFGFGEDHHAKELKTHGQVVLRG